MATIAYSGSTLKVGVASKATWTGLATNDDGQAIRNAEYSDRSVQISGTFGGGTCLIEGSNDGGTTWVTLSDTAGTALSFTSANLKQILQVTELIRPRVTGGAGVSINVNIVMASK